MGAAVSSSISSKRRYDIAFRDEIVTKSDEESNVSRSPATRRRNFVKEQSKARMVDQRREFLEKEASESLFGLKDIGVQTGTIRGTTSKCLSTQRRKFTFENSSVFDDRQYRRSRNTQIALVELKDIGIQTFNLSGFVTIELSEKLISNIAVFLDDTDMRSFLFVSRGVNTRLAPLFFRRAGILLTRLAGPTDDSTEVHATVTDEAMRSSSLVIETRVAYKLLMAWRRSQIRHSLTCACFSFCDLNDLEENMARLKDFFDSLPTTQIGTNEFRINRIILKFSESPSSYLGRPIVSETMNVIYRTQCEVLELIGLKGGKNLTLGRRAIDYGGIQIVTTMRSFICRSGVALTLNMLEWTLAHLVGNRCLTHVVLTNTGLVQVELDKGLAVVDVPNLRKFEVEDASFRGVLAFLLRHHKLEHVTVQGTDEVAENVPGFNTLVESLELPLLKSISATPSTIECIVGACHPQTFRKVAGIQLLLVKNGFFDTTSFLRFLNLSSITGASNPNLRTLDVTLVPLNKFLSPLFGHDKAFNVIQHPDGINHVVVRFSTDSQIQERTAVLRRAFALFQRLPRVRDITVVPLPGDDNEDIRTALHTTILQIPHVSFHFCSYSFD
ncbi:hypothetical protein SCHPADRAFT_1003377 [Schizopora paradoxa]|uniref:Uncharacterized protein n=1 Tax=Schizopora paradoxa TaxID=27342 RepID=A0A0H2R3T6_9AGAM|nr:hypothetical protein SCHPADRAFT_1003377 [Schizopora paradoxa]